jgi:hypothetical protein
MRPTPDAAGVDAVVSDQSFEEFFARDDLPQFAFVGLHGVWSWVSAANRARIEVEFQRMKHWEATQDRADHRYEARLS